MLTAARIGAAQTQHADHQILAPQKKFVPLEPISQTRKIL
jgi:hypothetical protein